MQQNAALKRIRVLLEKGRYQKRVLGNADNFIPVNVEERVHLDGLVYRPFIDTKANRMVYAATGNESQALFHVLSFSKYDFHYGDSDPYVWVDNDPGGFDHLT